MGSKGPRRRNARRTTIEPLEDRQMFSAEPLGGMLGGSIEQHAAPVPDFWYDTSLERDLNLLLGDVEQHLASAHQLTGVTRARDDYGFVGRGQTVAVIDSGIAWDHPNLGNGFGANTRIVGGWDFTEEDDANPYDDGPAGSHGTHVAGIIGATANAQGDSGVASSVDLVGLRVFNDQGSGYFSWVEKALKWVHTNRNSYANPITAINLSLGTSWNSATVPNWATLEDEFAQLKADGIFIAVSAGNSFSTYGAPGLSYPAASASVVPVMSVDDSGSLSYFSQRHSRAIAAPGRSIRSTVPDYVGNQNGRTDDWANYSGTSMASPYVAGASVVIREAMQFVGYTNITEDTIYNHMMTTADEFFDAATNQFYKRLNVGAAVDGLMPEDEFGSTAATAHDLGTIGSAGAEVNGLIGKRSDADYFRFTAVATGTVTFTADTTHLLEAAWTGDGVVSGSDGNAYTINVVAGQSYTVGLSSSDGIGYFDLTVAAESVFTFADWGTITQQRMNDFAANGETWYRVQASQNGYLTAEALFADTGGYIELAWFDVNMQQVATGNIGPDSQRVDRLVNAGEQFYLRVTGTNADVDFRLTNLVSVEGSTISVSGTVRDDTTVVAGGSTPTITVNGVVYRVDADAVSTIVFDGKAGNDTLVSKSDNSVVIRATNVESVSDFDARALVLKQDLGLRFSKSYYVNWSGFNEKWILGNCGWYFVTPDGSLFRATNSTSLAANPLIARFDASYYADPRLIHEARATSQVLDQQLIHQVANLGLHFNSSYYFNWGKMSEKWVLSNARKWYFITPDGALYKWAGGTGVTGSTMVANVGACCHADPTLLQDASLIGSSSAQLAHQLDTNFGLRLQSSYSTNWGGRSEKWIKGDGKAWYFITPSGGFYEWSGSNGVANSRLIATLDVSYYTTPSRLHDSVAPLANVSSVHVAAFVELEADTSVNAVGAAKRGGEANVEFCSGQQHRVTGGGRSGGHMVVSRRSHNSQTHRVALSHTVNRSRAANDSLHLDEVTHGQAFGDFSSMLADDFDWLDDVTSHSHATSIQLAFSQMDTVRDGWSHSSA